jgi:hypothetical protein
VHTTIDKKLQKVIEEVKKIKKEDFKPQDGTTWEVLLEDGTSYEKAPNTACFAATLRTITKCLKEEKKPKTIVYYVNETENKKAEILPTIVRRKWLVLLKKNGILKTKTPSLTLLTKGIPFDISDENLSPASLYLQLALCRYINEEPAVVTSVLKLTDAGAKFAPALGFSQSKFGRNQIHMVLPIIGGIYSSGNTANKLGNIISLNFFIKDRTFMDNRSFMKNAETEGTHGCWKFFSQLEAKSENIHLSDEENVFSIVIDKILEDESSKVMEKVNASKEKGEKIFV